MRKAYFYGEAGFAFVIPRQPGNRNIEAPPPDSDIPLMPDEEHGPPIDTPPDQPGTPENQPDPPPVKEPDPSEPVRLF
jgi:hypothetical protein